MRNLFIGGCLSILLVAGLAVAGDQMGSGNYGIVEGGGLPLSGGTLTGPLLLPDGTVGAPGAAFASDTNTGVYLFSADTLGFAAGGLNVGVLTSSYFQPGSSSGYPALIRGAPSATVPTVLPQRVGSDDGLGKSGNGCTTIIGSSTNLFDVCTTGATSTVPIDATAGSVFIKNGADPAATCTTGELYLDTDETDDTNCTTTADNVLCVCVSTNTWAAMGGL